MRHRDHFHNVQRSISPPAKSILHHNNLTINFIQKHDQIATDADGEAVAEFRAILVRLLVMISPLF